MSFLIEILTPLSLLILMGVILYFVTRVKPFNLSLKQSQIHAEFQRRIRELQENAPPELLNRDLKTANPETLKYVYLYFFLVFDEFHICKIISPKELKVLWDKFYAIGVKDALHRPAFRETLIKIYREDSNFMFFGVKKQFFEEMNRLHQEEFGKELIFRR